MTLSLRRPMGGRAQPFDREPQCWALLTPIYPPIMRVIVHDPRRGSEEASTADPFLRVAAPVRACARGGKPCACSARQLPVWVSWPS
jgi:hypothetical protein